MKKKTKNKLNKKVIVRSKKNVKNVKNLKVNIIKNSIDVKKELVKNWKLYKMQKPKVRKVKVKVGAFLKDQNISILELYNDYSNILQKDMEYCGYILKQPNNTFNLHFINTGPNAKIYRGACDIGRSYPIIWHTHPNVSKYYPSLEDIFKVIKHSIIDSLIFSQYGYWYLNCNNKTEDRNIPQIQKQEVNTILDDFYRYTNSGREYDKNKSFELADRLTSYLVNYGFKINWIELDQSFTSVFN